MLFVKIDCIGGGSIGMLVAGRLAAALQEVRLVTRSSEQSEALTRSGLQLVDPVDQATTLLQVRTIEFNKYQSCSSTAEAAPDWIMLTLKQKDIDGLVLEAIRINRGPDTRVCCFQNGMGHLEKLQSVIGGECLYAAVTTEGAMRKSPVQVWHTGRGMTKIGKAAGEAGGLMKAADKAAVEQLVQIMNGAGLCAELSNWVEKDMWNKLIMNTAINPVTALLEIPNGELVNSAESLELMKSLYEEAVKLADAVGASYNSDLWDSLLAVVAATSGNLSSMLQDLRAGRRTEMDWLTGYLLERAGRAGVDLPTHKAVYRLVKAKEQHLQVR